MCTAVMMIKLNLERKKLENLWHFKQWEDLQWHVSLVCMYIYLMHFMQVHQIASAKAPSLIFFPAEGNPITLFKLWSVPSSFSKLDLHRSVFISSPANGLFLSFCWGHCRYPEGSLKSLSGLTYKLSTHRVDHSYSQPWWAQEIKQSDNTRGVSSQSPLLFSIWICIFFAFFFSLLSL